MSKTGFTPGPWEYTRQVGISHGISVAGEDRGKPETFGTIAKVGSAANARLISAAPELYEALITALPLLEGFDDGDRAQCDDGDDPIVAPVLAQVRAALAKARGEQ